MDQPKSVNSQSLISRRSNVNQYRNRNQSYMFQRMGNTYSGVKQPDLNPSNLDESNLNQSNVEQATISPTRNQNQEQDFQNPYERDENKKSNHPLDNVDVVDGTPIIKLGGQNVYEPDTRMANFYHGYEDDYVHIDSISQYDRRRGYRRKYSSDKAYPSIHIEEENNELGTMLLECYAAELSELSSVTRYSYLNIVLDNEYEEIKEIYRGLSIVELHHMNMIGELIKQLGVMPRYYHKNKNNITMWNGNYVPGKYDMESTLLDSIQHEKDMINKYNSIIERVDHIVIKEVLSRIIMDEVIHISLLEELKKKYIKNG